MKVYVLFDTQTEKFLTKAYTEKSYAMSARRGKMELGSAGPLEWRNLSPEKQRQLAKERFKVYQISGTPEEV